MDLIYHIGEQYRYPHDKKQFRLVDVNSDVFRFECGHWCFGSCFEDLVRVKTGIQVYQEKQLTMGI